MLIIVTYRYIFIPLLWDELLDTKCFGQNWDFIRGKPEVSLQDGQSEAEDAEEAEAAPAEAEEPGLQRNDGHGEDKQKSIWWISFDRNFRTKPM
jgi:hypothetical protein